jgi:CubicO group peptidase (beta-lactamase class C family)
MNLDQRIQSLLDEATSDSRHGIPGAVFVAVDRTGTQIAAISSGVKGLKEKVPMTLDTIFYIASCTKLVTVIAALQLVEQGKLHLDEPEQVSDFNLIPSSRYG